MVLRYTFKEEQGQQTHIPISGVEPAWCHRRSLRSKSRERLCHSAHSLQKSPSDKFCETCSHAMDSDLAKIQVDKLRRV